MGFFQESWIGAGGTEKFDHQSSMRNEVVPEIQVEVRVVTNEASDEVIPVGLDDALGGICAM